MTEPSASAIEAALPPLPRPVAARRPATTVPTAIAVAALLAVTAALLRSSRRRFRTARPPVS